MCQPNPCSGAYLRLGEHKYLQNLVKEFAISRGYHAVIEEQILDGVERG
jgi:hypothetical protein